MATIVGIILLILGIYFAENRKGEYLYHYVLIWICFAPFILSLFHKTLQSDIYTIYAWINYLGYAVFFIRLVSIEINKKCQFNLIALLCLLLLYSMILSFFRNTPVLDNVKFITSQFGILVLFISTYNDRFNYKSFYKLLFSLLAFELILGLIQYYFHIFNYSYEADAGIVERINGTFPRNNIFVEFLTPIAIIISYLQFSKYGKLKVSGIIFLLLIGFESFISGVRTVLIAYIIIIIPLFYILLKGRVHSKFGIAMMTIVYGGLFYLAFTLVMSFSSSLGITYTKNADDNVSRQNVLASILNDKSNSYIEEQTTLGLTYIVFQDFSENPIVGPGYYFQGNGYGGIVNPQNGNMTDATLAVYICETGIIGIIIAILIYRVLLIRFYRPSWSSNLIFFYFLIVTIADPGLFCCWNMILLFSALKYGNRIQSGNIKQRKLN